MQACPRPQGVHWAPGQLRAAQRALTQDTCAPAQELPFAGSWPISSVRCSGQQELPSV